MVLELKQYPKALLNDTEIFEWSANPRGIRVTDFLKVTYDQKVISQPLNKSHFHFPFSQYSTQVSFAKRYIPATPDFWIELGYYNGLGQRFGYEVRLLNYYLHEGIYYLKAIVIMG